MSHPSSHFEVLGLPRRYALDAGDLERNYLLRSRELHPDYHQQGSTAQQRLSLERTAALNDAYATLRDPFRRAEYLLALEGGPSAAEIRDMTPEFLEEMLELRMEIEEVRGERDEVRLQALEQQLSDRRERLLLEISEQFAILEHLPAADSRRQPALVQIRRLLNTTRYVNGLLRDLRGD